MSISKSDQVLLDSAKDVQQVYDDVNSDIAVLRGKLSRLEAEWVGRGGTAFQSTIQRWDDAARRTTAALLRFKEELGNVESNYTVTEDQVEQVFNRYAAGLG
ncbi:WXG100 family type VII secretion target [Nocardioides daejeonensis]|uniref:WXG100 family type VII secretion target n=1 Tax=Nocardioides daejeonensis TaxID=1046556 RepID=UPI000D742B4C|nr:WXG100 family type VII secretion target [Nocardioides daejeonensis]